MDDDDDVDDDEAEMDVDDDDVQDDAAMEHTSNRDNKRTTEDSLLPESIEISTVHSELSLDASHVVLESDSVLESIFLRTRTRMQRTRTRTLRTRTWWTRLHHCLMLTVTTGSRV